MRTAAPAFQECLKHLPRPPPPAVHAGSTAAPGSCVARPPRGRKPASQVSQHRRPACAGAVGIPGETTVKPLERTDKGQVIFQKMLFNESWLQQAEQESSTVAFFPPRVPPSPVSSGRSRGGPACHLVYKPPRGPEVQPPRRAAWRRESTGPCLGERMELCSH